jgi:hypothetical protein
MNKSLTSIAIAIARNINVCDKNSVPKKTTTTKQIKMNQKKMADFYTQS